MAIPKEPRQKMINMMYLVLTALLALNVSSEILNAFKTVNKSLESSNQIVDASTSTLVSSLEKKKEDPTTKAKAEEWAPRAEQAVNFAKDVNGFITSLKNQILKEANFNPETGKFKEDNLDIATRIMVEKGAGKELYSKLDKFKKDILGIDPLIKAEFEQTLPINLEKPATKNKGNNTWEAAYFRMVPTVAALTILSKFQNDVKSTENRVVQFCHNKVGEVVVRNDSYAAFAAADANYVMPGEKINILAGVGGFSKAASPTISVDGKVIPLGQDGTATTELTAGSFGNHKINVNFVYTDQDGNKQTVLKTIEYTVGQSNASIALDKMNVLYIGVDNPVTIAASSGGDDKVRAEITGGGGTINKTGKGSYTAKVNSVTDECYISVYVEGKLAGRSKFRTRTIPRPIAVVGSYESGANVPAGAFRAQAGVGAGIKDFPFELQYKVTRFVISADDDSGYINDAACTGNTWSAEARNIINGLKTGRTVTIDEIYAVGPDGRSQKLPSLVYYIK